MRLLVPILLLIAACTAIKENNNKEIEKNEEIEENEGNEGSEEIEEIEETGEIEENEETEEIDEVDDAEATRVKAQFNKYFVCPYYIEEPPSVKLSVTFSSAEVDLGNKLPAYVASIPPYIYYEAEPDKFYCIIICDCDTPYAGAPIYSQSINALLVNIKGNNLAGCDYLTSFQPCVPYVGSGYHRYVILLFQQPEKIDITTPEMQNRHKNLTNFSVKGFASQYGLGNSIAGNFFLTKTNVCNNEDYKPIVCSL